MICPHCGTNNKDGNVFCTECGWKLIRPEPAMEETPKAPQTDFQRPQREETSHSTSGGFGAGQPSHQSTGYGAEEPVRKVGFVEAVVSFFKNYVKFEGRATRSELWYVVLFSCIVSIVLSLIGNLAGDGVEKTLNTIWTLATLLPSLAIGWRRMHDIGKSGLMNLLALIPLVGWIIVIVYYCKASEGDNQYGPRKTESNC